MTIRFACPWCGRRLVSEDHKAGKSSKCPVCGSAVTVPSNGPGGQVAGSAIDMVPIGPVEPATTPSVAAGPSMTPASSFLENDLGIFQPQHPLKGSKVEAHQGAGTLRQH